jgi:hypothetical protein
MRILASFVLIFVTASAGAARPVSDEKQILQLEDEWVRALEKQDREALNKILPGSSPL